MTEDLREEAERFAERLTDLFAAVLVDPPVFGVNIVTDQGQAIIGAEPFVDNQPSDVPLVRVCDEADAPALFLRVRYTVEMDVEDRYLQVCTSSLGLWVDVTAGKNKPRPVVRVEYDREPQKPDRASAHVHLHANSPELAWVYGSCGHAAPNLHDLHFPVGGRRFRPTIEEFLLFLDRENLFTDWNDGWKAELLVSLAEWEQRQARATARRYPEAVARELRVLGYTVSAQSDGELAAADDA